MNLTNDECVTLLSCAACGAIPILEDMTDAQREDFIQALSVAKYYKPAALINDKATAALISAMTKVAQHLETR